MRREIAVLVTVAALAATGEEFDLSGGIAATIAPDGSVTFSAGGASLGFAPFEISPAAKMAAPQIKFRADGDALVETVGRLR